MEIHPNDNMFFGNGFEAFQPPYDLGEAQINGYCRVKMNHEWLRLKIVDDGKDGEDIFGSIGVFEYNISEIHRRLVANPTFKDQGYAIYKFYPPDYDYKTSDLVTRIIDYVYRFKVGEKQVLFIINYLNKIWDCQIIGYHPNPFAREMGGKFESLDHYIQYQKSLILEKEVNKT